MAVSTPDRVPAQITDAACARRVAQRPLPDSAVTAILEAYASGSVSVRELALRHGRVDSSISKIIHGETHTHVPGPRLSSEELTDLSAKHRREAVRRAGAERKGAHVCRGCGGKGHQITRCPDPRGR